MNNDIEILLEVTEEFFNVEPSISWIDKVLLWNPCNPWVPVPRKRLSTAICNMTATPLVAYYFS